MTAQVTEVPAAAAPPLLAVAGVDVVLGHGWRASQVLTGVDLDIWPGEIVGLVGETGSGKTTLARTIVGLVRPRPGRVVFAAPRSPACAAPRGRRERRSGHVQLVFQDPLRSLDPDLTVAEIVGEGLTIRGGLDAAEISERVDDALAKVGLDAALRDRTPGQISGGQRQRVSIARALAAGPKLLLCDEPVSALDASNRNYILRLLAELRDSLGLPIVIISHDLRSLAGIADRVVVLYRGRIVEDGPVGQVFTAPRHPYTALLMASAPACQARPAAHGPPVAPDRRRPAAADGGTARACSPPAARSRSPPAPCSRPSTVPRRTAGPPPATATSSGANSPASDPGIHSHDTSRSTEGNQVNARRVHRHDQHQGPVGNQAHGRPGYRHGLHPALRPRPRRRRVRPGAHRLRVVPARRRPGRRLRGRAHRAPRLPHRAPPGLRRPHPGRPHRSPPSTSSPAAASPCTSSPAAATPSSAATATTSPRTSGTTAPTSTWTSSSRRGPRTSRSATTAGTTRSKTSTPAVKSPQQPRIKLYFGGSSAAAYRVGGKHADIYALWGEPLAETKEQIDSVNEAAKKAGRDDPAAASA